jgi:hypothetical protein
MTSQVRQEVLRVLSDLSECCPDVRFGQLIANLPYMAKGPANEAIWDLEDEELLAAARKHLEERRDKTSARQDRALQPTAGTQKARRG